MKKILIGYFDDLKGSGVDKYIRQFLSAIGQEDVEIGLLTASTRDLSSELPGIKIHTVPRIPHPVMRIKTIQKIIEENDYDTVYFNISTCYNCQGNIAARRASNKPRIFTHSHSSGITDENPKKRMVSAAAHRLCKPTLVRDTDCFLSCSGLAADWLYGKNHPYTLIRNCTDTEKFSFDENLRKQWREKLGLTDNYVIGFAGRLSYQKNIFVLLDILQEVLKEKPDAKLLMFGEGPLRQEFSNRAKELGLENHILMPGVTDKLNEAYSAMDLFVLPSRLEGMPLVGIEAQVNGLPCMFSEGITRELQVTDSVCFVDPDHIDISAIKPLLNLKRGSGILYEDCIVDEKEQAEQLRKIFL